MAIGADQRKKSEPWVKVLRAMALAGSASLLATSAAAHNHPATTLDVMLLRSNAIVFATVKEIQGIEREQTFSVVFERAALAFDRIAVTRDRALTLRLRGSRNGNRLRVDPLLPDIEVGSRYLLLLQSDGRSDIALSDHTQSLYRIGQGGIECAGGHLYGLGSNSFVCSTPAWHYGAPIDEARLQGWITRAFDLARTRHPELAAQPNPPSAARRTP